MRQIRLKSVLADRDGLLVEWNGETQQKGSVLLCAVTALEDRPEYGVTKGKALEVACANVVEGEEQAPQ